MLSTIEKALFLKTVKLFEGMSAEQLKTLTHISEEMQCPGGEILFREGDPCDNLYVIVTGEVEIVKRHGGPDETLLAALGPGASFGEMAVFGNEGRSAAALVSKDSTFLAISKEHLLLFIRENPSFSKAIIAQLAAIIARMNAQVLQARTSPAGVAAAAGAEAEEGKKRRPPRYEVPAVVEVPGLTEAPLAVDNLSEGGVCLAVPQQPDFEREYEIALKVQGEQFRWAGARVAWARKDASRNNSWAVGFRVRMSDEERGRIAAALAKMAV